MVRFSLVVVFLCWFVVAPLSAQTTLLSPDGWFDSRWSEQTDNVGVEAAHRCTLVHKADGSVQVWGRTTFPLNVPSLPTGVVWSSASVSGGRSFSFMLTIFSLICLNKDLYQNNSMTFCG
jgi:hypothetical protein